MGTSFSFDQWSSTNPIGGWTFVAAAFDDDLWTDIAGYQASNGVVSIGQSTLRPVEGYCWPLSAAPGETIQFMMSGQGASQALIQSHSSTGSAIDSVTMMTLNFDAVSSRCRPCRGNSGAVGTNHFR